MNDPDSTEAAANDNNGFFHFKKEEIQSVKLVVLGGMLGGILQPAVAQLNPSQTNPTWPNIFLGPILGIAAAGISVFVLANSRTDDRMRLLFFSLLCGLAFPAVLTGALDSVSPRSQAVEERAEEIATTAAEGNISGAAAALAKTMRENPTVEDVDRMAEAKVDKAADGLVSDLASKAEAGNGPDADKAIGQLKQLGTAARAGGYDGTAIRVNKALREIEASSGVDAEQREHAGKAADDIIGLQQQTPAVAPGY
jgi:fluoride ion exporter CrcB/FEX